MHKESYMSNIVNRRQLTEHIYSEKFASSQCNNKTLLSLLAKTAVLKNCFPTTNHLSVKSIEKRKKKDIYRHKFPATIKKHIFST